MHKQIVMYYMFSLLQISAGMTEFPCYFPCPWHNQTFRDDSSSTYWTFNADGRTSSRRTSDGPLSNFRCHQITERFLIVRSGGSDNFRCLSINYNPDIPLEFIMGGWNRFRSVNQTTAFTDLCAFCKVPDVLFLWKVGWITSPLVNQYSCTTEPPSTPLPLSLGCNRPSSCSPPGVVCNTSDTIPKACPTTTVSPPTTADPKTTKSHCGKKQPTRLSA